MSTSIQIILNRVNNTIEVQKDGVQLEMLDVSNYVPALCIRSGFCTCKTVIDSFFRGVIMKYRGVYGRRSNLIEQGDLAIIQPTSFF